MDCENRCVSCPTCRFVDEGKSRDHCNYFIPFEAPEDHAPSGQAEFTGFMVKVVKKERFRSKPVVNMAADMVRVTLTMPIWKWREIEKGLA